MRLLRRPSDLNTGTAVAQRLTILTLRLFMYGALASAWLWCALALLFYPNLPRWLGGLLTNFQTVKKSIHKLRELDRQAAEGYGHHLTKKELAKLERARAKLEKSG